MNQAQKWRSRAARYREFAALSCDGATRRARLARAQRFERLADEIEGGGGGAPRVPRAAPPAFAPLAALRRVFGRAADRLGAASTSGRPATSNYPILRHPRA